MAKCHTQFIPALVAWFILALSTATFFFFPCQYLQEHYRFPIAIIQGIITFFVFSNFFLAQLMDPGVIPKSSPDEVQDDDFRAPLYKSINIDGVSVRMKWCVTCRFYRPPRCSHCSVCDSCIDTFDHHCPWVNNCIGHRNYRHFFFFLLFLCIHMGTILGWCIMFIVNHKEELRDRDSVITVGLMVVDIFFCVPIFGLTIFHVMLVSKGRTTSEQITGKFQNGQNPFTRGCWTNWCNILCGPHLPRYRCQNRKSSSNRRQKNKLHRIENDLETNNHHSQQPQEHQLALLPPRYLPMPTPQSQLAQQQTTAQQLQQPSLQQPQSLHQQHLVYNQLQRQQNIQQLQQFQNQQQQIHGTLQQQQPQPPPPPPPPPPLPPPLPPPSHQHLTIPNDNDNQKSNQQPVIMSPQQKQIQSDPSQASTQMQHVHYNSQSQQILMDWEVY